MYTLDGDARGPVKTTTIEEPPRRSAEREGGRGRCARARAHARMYESRGVGRGEGERRGIVGQAPSPSRRRTIGRPGGRDKSALLTIKRELRYARAAVLPSTGTSFAESLGIAPCSPPTPNTPVTLCRFPLLRRPRRQLPPPNRARARQLHARRRRRRSRRQTLPRSPIRASSDGGSIPPVSPYVSPPFATLDYPYFPLLARSHHAPVVHGRHPMSGAAAFETGSVTRVTIMLQTRRATAMHTR